MATSTNKMSLSRLRLVSREAAAPERTFNDGQLVAAVRAGDGSAATNLHDRIRPHIESTVRRLLGSRDPDQEDIVQHVIIELVSNIDRYRGDCPLQSWASGIAANVIYNHIRRRKLERRIFRALGDELLEATASSSRVGRDGSLRSVMSRVLNHLDAMEEKKAWAFFLHDVWGYDLREIAEITGASVSAAQTRLVRGRREIQERIAGDPELANVLQTMDQES